jgi:hypothetical protein
MRKQGGPLLAGRPAGPADDKPICYHCGTAGEWLAGECDSRGRSRTGRSGGCVALHPLFTASEKSLHLRACYQLHGPDRRRPAQPCGTAAPVAVPGQQHRRCRARPAGARCRTARPDSLRNFLGGLHGGPVPGRPFQAGPWRRHPRRWTVRLRQKDRPGKHSRVACPPLPGRRCRRSPRTAPARRGDSRAQTASIRSTICATTGCGCSPATRTRRSIRAVVETTCRISMPSGCQRRQFGCSRCPMPRTR